MENGKCSDILRLFGKEWSAGFSACDVAQVSSLSQRPAREIQGMEEIVIQNSRARHSDSVFPVGDANAT